MTSLERDAIASLVHRLYGGPSDGDIGDIVEIRAEQKEMRKDLTEIKTAMRVVAGIAAFFGFGGILWLVQAAAEQARAALP